MTVVVGGVEPVRSRGEVLWWWGASGGRVVEAVLSGSVEGCSSGGGDSRRGCKGSTE